MSPLDVAIQYFKQFPDNVVLTPGGVITKLKEIKEIKDERPK